LTIDRFSVIGGTIVLASFLCLGASSGCRGGPGSPGVGDPNTSSENSGSGDGTEGSSGGTDDIGMGASGGQGGREYSNFGPCGLDGGVTCFERRGEGPNSAMGVGCKMPETCEGESFACGHPSHCNGQSCCADTSNGSIHAICKADCNAAGEIRLCDVDADCGEGGTCTLYRCPQWVVAAVKACSQPAGCN